MIKLSSRTQSPHVFCRLFIQLSSFSVIVETSGLVLIRITAVVSPDEHFLKQLSFTWFSINHVLVSNLIIRWSLEERLFLSGGMIFISPSFTSHLTETCYWRDRATAVHLLYCNKDLQASEISASAAHSYFAVFPHYMIDSNMIFSIIKMCKCLTRCPAPGMWGDT